MVFVIYQSLYWNKPNAFCRISGDKISSNCRLLPRKDFIEDGLLQFVNAYNNTIMKTGKVTISINIRTRASIVLIWLFTGITKGVLSACNLHVAHIDVAIEACWLVVAPNVFANVNSHITLDRVYLIPYQGRICSRDYSVNVVCEVPLFKKST